MSKKRIFVAGHKGMVGSAIVQQLSDQQDVELIVRTRSELDLLSQKETHDFFQQNKIDEVYLAAAKVGGIHANNEYPADFIYQNLMIQSNILEGAREAGVTKLLLLGSSCIYPKLAKQPMAESELLTGLLEPTNEPYAIAKIAGIKMCESYNRQYGTDYRSVMPTNLYGENDNFHPENSHVIPAMLRRFHLAKLNGDGLVQVWGTGKPKREFLHVADMASACVFLMSLDKNEFWRKVDQRLSHVNVGTGIDVTIAELAFTIAKVVGFQGDIAFDASKPDGTPRKLLDVSMLSSLGWEAILGLEEGLQRTYKWFLENENSLRFS
jgi:GDP-L-fucose synthase